jgi:hypothetical protein
VSLDFHTSPVGVQCSCGSGEKDPACKHSLALLLWRARELTAGALMRNNHEILL